MKVWMSIPRLLLCVLGLPLIAHAQVYSKTETIEYHDDLVLWVLGQAKRTATNGVEVSRTDYDGKALPWKTYAFGKLQQTLAYNADGTLLTVKDGNNNTTTFANWKRGIPQTITFADAKVKSAVVDDLGQISSVTDENGYTTKYGYDAMGRLSLIDYPDADTVNWANTTRSFVQSGTAVYGLAAGHWEQTVTTGNGRRITYFDALWRPVVVSEYDNANVAGTLRQSVTRYDAEGRPTFVSYPQRSQDAAVINTWGNPAVAPNATGTDTTYDVLGRVLTTKADSELGALTTSYEYLTGFQTRITNPRGFKTITSYMAYDQPTTDWPVAITHAEGAYTNIDRDVFGKPTSILRHNADNSDWNRRYFAYDAYQQLCKSTEVETGTTAYGYDAAGNLTWSAAALPWSPAAPCEYTVNHASVVPKRIDRGYDTRNRLKTLSFPGGNGNQAWTYTPDGLPAQVTTWNDEGTSTVVNTYAYNKRRLLASETQHQPAMPVWGLGYGYDANGALASLTYPSGLSVAYAPNALGQPTRAGSYATGVSYYPNGAAKQFTYGNGIVHTMTQNTRQLPEQSIDSGGVLNDSYDYDQNGNVAAISDGLIGARGNRDMTYDGLDRLKTVVSPMFGAGGASYAYDSLDNLTRVKIGGAATRDYYYCYDTHQQLTNIKTGGCAGTSVIGLGYDMRGNLANRNGVQHQFDYGNRLREVTGKEAYSYDGYGRRVSAEATQGGIYSFYDQNGTLRYQRDERKAAAYDYITLNGSLVARVTGQAVVVGTPTITAPASSSGSYTVQWTAVALATSYQLQEALNGGSWQAAYTGAGTSLAVSGKTSGSYAYQVRACRDTVCGNWSVPVAVAVNIPPASAPTLSAPASAPNGNYSVTWIQVAGATSYTLEESANGGAWGQAYSGAGISQSYTAKPAGSYAYRVKACNLAGCSAVSTTVTVRAFYAPGAPGITAPNQSNNGSYTVSWNSVSGATSYRLEERVGTGAWTEIQNSAAVSKAFTGKADGSYSYRARACNAAGCSAYSAIASVSVLTPPTAIAAITTPATSYTGAYTVSWTAVAKATRYTLQRSINGGAWSTIYTGAGLSFGVTGQGQGSYGYRVQGCNTVGCGGWSPTKTTVVQFIPAVPATLTGYTEVDTEIRPPLITYYIDWSASSGATYYELQQNWVSSTIVYSGPNTGFIIDGRGTRSYLVRACNPAGCSAWKGPLTL
jgi:YD repeat-containing protein